jgi:hypothetical protein
MQNPALDRNAECNMADHDCGSGGKVDVRSCKCICGPCRTGKFCTTVKKTAECAKFEEKDFRSVNKKVINKFGDDDLKKKDPLLKEKLVSLDEQPNSKPNAILQIPAQHKDDIANKLGDLVAEGKNFNEKAMIDQDEKKVKADFESIQSGAMIEMASKHECEKGCEKHGLCNPKGVCECFPGFTGKACSEEKACPNGCSGRGICKYGLCFCNPGFSGKDCTKVDTSFKPQQQKVAKNTVSAAANVAATPVKEEAKEQSSWHTSGVIIVGCAMFTIGVAAGLFSKFISDKRKRSEAKKILEETNHGDFEEDSMRNVLYSSLASPPMPMPPTVGL